MTSRWFIILFFIYVLGFLAHALYLQKTVYGDGIYYFSWLRSAVVDHDINFRNEYRYFSVGSQTTPLGLPGNKYAIGTPLLWSPAYVAVFSIYKKTGYELPYQLAVGITSVIYAYVGLVLLYLLLTRYFNTTVSLLTIIAIALSTHLLFYGSLDSVNSHAVSFFAAALYLSFLLAKRKNWFMIGLSLGLVGLIRTQDLIYGILILPMTSFDTLIPGIRRGLLGLAVVFLPQLIAWQALYGKFWVSPYLSGGEFFTPFHPYIIEVLFSFQNGLFLWTPLVLLGLIGLWWFNKKQRAWYMALILLQLYIVSSWSTWTQGASYSGRMFVSILPLVAFGVAQLFQLLSKRGWTTTLATMILVGPLCLLNALSIVIFLAVH